MLKRFFCARDPCRVSGGACVQRRSCAIRPFVAMVSSALTHTMLLLAFGHGHAAAAGLRGVVGGNATVMVGAGEQCVAKGGDCGNGDHSAPAKACCEGPCQPWWPGTPDGRPYGYQCASPPAPDVPCLPARSDCSKGGSCCDGMECQTTTGADGTIFGERCVYP